MKKLPGVIEIKVKTVWKGMVGFPEKFQKTALEANSALRIIVGDEEMFIPAEKVAEIKTISEYLKDRFGGEPYRLVYYKWKPSYLQETLF